MASARQRILDAAVQRIAREGIDDVRIARIAMDAGVSAGLLLCFIIVFNEYLVTLFVHPPDVTTAPLRVFNLVRTAGLAPTTAALAVTMQLISFGAILVFFKVFGTRYLKGTYLI